VNVVADHTEIPLKYWEVNSLGEVSCQAVLDKLLIWVPEDVKEQHKDWAEDAVSPESEGKGDLETGDWTYYADQAREQDTADARHLVVV
jgi:hypothetical protein